MDSFVTAGRPTGSLGEEIVMVEISDQNLAVACLLLEVALQTECLIALGQHSLIDGAVR